MSSGVERHRQHPAARPEQPGDPVEPVDVVVQQLPERDDQQVAHRVAVHLAVGLEPVLEHLGPGLSPPVVAAQGRQRHPQVTGREHAELLAQPSRRAAVVGDRDHRRQVGGQPPQRGQGRGQPVPATQRDDRRLGRPAHPRPTPDRGRGGWPRPRSPASRSRADDLLGHRDAAVLAAGAADRHGHEPLALAQVAGADRLDHGNVALEELLGVRPVLDVRRHVGVLAGAVTQLGHPVRVRQEPHVGHQVGVDRHAVLEPEADHGDPQLHGVRACRTPRRPCRLSWWTLSGVVSMTRSASPRRLAITDALRVMPSSSRPVPWSGCGRRAASWRRTRMSSAASR